MLIKIYEIMQSIFSVWALIAFLSCGAWSFLMVNPALAERKMVKEAAVAKWGGLLYLFGGIGIYLLLKIAGFFLVN